MKNEKIYSLPFGIEYVVMEDLAKDPSFRTWKAAGSSFDITCPFCNGKRKMNVNTTKNVARCNKCGGNEGYNTITLHAKLTNLSNKEAYMDLVSRWEGKGNGFNTSFGYVSKNEEDIITPFPIEIRDRVYRKILANLSLSKRHYADLKKRGLTDEEIKRNLYKSVPVVGLHSLALEAINDEEIQKCIKENPRCGIPGFVNISNGEKVSIKGRKNGYLIPVLNRNGLISGMQIRYDELREDASEIEKENYKKYSWYSSSEDPNGCSVTGCENIHFAGNWNTLLDEINLTEGVLKADIASFLSNTPFLGLVGVSNIKQLPLVLKSLYETGTKKVNLYIDMDYRKKKEVAVALLNIKKEINRIGEHEYIIFNNTDGDFNIFLDSNEVIIQSSKALPSECLLFIERAKVPREEYEIENNEIRLNREYMEVLSNKTHKIRIVDLSSMPKNYMGFSLPEKKKALKNNILGVLELRKTGLEYSEKNWDEKYNGIDDYYLYLRSIGKM